MNYMRNSGNILRFIDYILSLVFIRFSFITLLYSPILLTSIQFQVAARLRAPRSQNARVKVLKPPAIYVHASPSLDLKSVVCKVASVSTASLSRKHTTSSDFHLFLIDFLFYFVINFLLIIECLKYALDFARFPRFDWIAF